METEKNFGVCIIVRTSDGDTSVWPEQSYSDYSYDGKVFVVKGPKGEWIGVYNIDAVDFVEVRELHQWELEALSGQLVSEDWDYEEGCECGDCCNCTGERSE